MKEHIFAAVIFVLALVFTVVFVLVTSYYEARAYNRLCGTNVSTTDAIFLSLRVEGNCRSES